MWAIITGIGRIHRMMEIFLFGGGGVRGGGGGGGERGRGFDLRLNSFFLSPSLIIDLGLSSASHKKL